MSENPKTETPQDPEQAEPTLDDFEAWCRGNGRIGGGIHYNALDALDRFKMFWNRKLLKSHPFNY